MPEAEYPHEGLPGMFSDFSTVWVQFFLTHLVCFWSPTGEEQGSGRIFSCVGAHYGLPFPSGLQGRTCFLLWLLCLCEEWSTSHSPVPALPLTTRDKFPQPCVRVNTVTLVHIRWVDEYMDFISMKYFPKGEVGIVSQSTAFKLVGYDTIWGVTAECRDCEYFGKW